MQKIPATAAGKSPGGHEVHVVASLSEKNPGGHLCRVALRGRQM